MTLNIVFAGTPEFAVPSLDVLADGGHRLCAVYTQPDRPAGRGRSLTPSPVKQRAIELGLEIRQPRQLRDETKVLAAFQCDLMVVVAYGLMLPATWLGTPRLGCINVHASLLPRWRGAAPIQQAILAGDDQTGISVMQMDEGLDTGPILDQATIDIPEAATAGDLHEDLARLGAIRLDRVVNQLAHSAHIHPQLQDDAGASYAPRINKEDGILDWQQSADALARCVRAYNPWPVACAQCNDGRLRIFSAGVESYADNVAPGTILAVERDGLRVACGEDVLRLSEVQLPGRRRITFLDLMNAHAGLFSAGVSIDTVSLGAT